MEGITEARAAGARAGSAEIVPDEMDAARAALDRARPGDLVVLCVDYATDVFKELEARRGVASPTALLASEAGPFESVGGDIDLVGMRRVEPPR